MRTGTGRYADRDTVARVAVREGTARGRAQDDRETRGYPLPAQDLNCPQFGTTEAQVTARVEDVMAMIAHVATVTGLGAAYRHSCRGAAVATPFIIAGGVLLGGVGIFLGGTLGGFVGWMVSEDFKSVPQVLMELSSAEKQKLCAEAMAVVKNFDWTDACQLIKLVMSNSVIKGKVLGVLKTFITNELRATPKYRK